ncbi:TonB-dependent receptor [uncultured Brevundimonas sp.]|uniref:TonB-dependent receptor n=1 Tax=uncultured Brevundimonas sp. TaxID=213418 RepID=UPI0030EC423A|tara:strand:+ start:37228 stop:39456 length:2229 start_codon:yes stop_codon:yes gene_type:complete
MNRYVKTALLAGAALSALSTAAMAQDTGAMATGPQASMIDDVIVTARRRDEQLKDVPVAVTALGAERLEETGASDITALQQQTPNATVQAARGSNSTLISFVRGVGQQDPLWGFEPGVGLYIDDVYVARPQGAVLDIFDIQRIEVLRGPQGSLYGRNTIGGAIKYVTSRLSIEPEATVRGTYGSYNQMDFLASASIPVSDNLRIGGAFASYNRDGYGQNLNTGAESYDKDVLAARVSAEFQPNDNSFFRLAYDRTVDKSNPRHGHREVAGTGVGAGVTPNVYDTYAGVGDNNSVITEGVSLTGEFYLNDNLTFKSISAYRSGETDTVIDFDNTPAPTLDIPAVYGDHQFTQEFQLQFEGDRVQGVVGAYYLNAKASGAFDTILGNFGFVIGTGGFVETESFSLYSDVNGDLTDRLHLSIGLRYTQDSKTGDVFRANYLGATRSPLLGGTARAPFQVRTDYTNSRDFTDISPRFALSYDFSDRITGYASFSTGFKSGGFDMRGDANVTPNTVNGYEPETVDAYEIGLKGSAFNRRLSFSSALFYNEYQDQQVTTQVPAGTPLGSAIASFVDNVGSSTISGAEFEGTLHILDSLTANFAVGYLNAEFDEFQRFNLGTGLYENIADQVVLQNAPKYTGYFGLTWRGQMAGGALAITPSISYRDDYSQFEFPNPILDQEAYSLVDLSVVWTAPNDKLTVGVYGKNLTDEEYRIGGYNFPGAAVFNDSVIGYYGPPRTVSAMLQVKF